MGIISPVQQLLDLIGLVPDNNGNPVNTGFGKFINLPLDDRLPINV
jgi:hypothetical protein